MNNIKNIFYIFRSGIVAGLFIGIAALTYLKLGGFYGSLMFAFGLLCVTHYGVKLYTGTAGFIKNYKDIFSLLIILLGNLVGTYLFSVVLKHNIPELIPQTTELITNKFNNNDWYLGSMSVGCGIIMTAAVKFAREEKYLPLIFGVPAFIICGFPHCIADSVYIFMSNIDLSFITICKYLLIVFGNFIGCNLCRWVLYSK